ncbi:MAG: 2-oxoacid:ferredoxin oxidoreductase subunit beta, partial [bacterium]|nr:2-oxoacid:ferredoxin oxidoreductase subunit beta [bacterium]
PVQPISVAPASETTLVARSIDTYGSHLQETIARAAAHRGSTFVEILQNCPIFNDGAFADVEDRKLRSETTLELVDGEPLVFGASRDLGIRMNKFQPEVVELNKTRGQLLAHDESNPALGYLLSQLQRPDFPVPIGVFRAVEEETYEGAVHRQIREARARKAPPSLDQLLRQGDVWEVPAKGAQSDAPERSTP